MHEILKRLVIDPLVFSHGYDFYGSYVVYGAIAIFFLSSLMLWYWTRQILAELRAVNRFLAKAGRNSAVSRESFDKINGVFQNKRHLIHPWSEFTEGVIDESAGTEEPCQFRSTCRASRFFNFTDLIAKDSGIPFYQEVPQLLTGLGIVGTFLGLVTGLPDGGNTDATQQINTVFGSMSGAYVASVWGVSLALTFSVIKKLNFGRLNAEISALAISLDRAFKRVSSEEYLLRAAQNSMAQLDEMKSLAIDLPRRLVENMTGAGIANNIDEAVKVNLSEGFKAINQSITEVQVFHRDFVATATQIQHTFVKLGLGLGNATSAVQLCSSLLENSGRTLEQGVGSIDKATDKWSTAARGVIELIEKQQGAGEAMRDAVTLTNQNLDKFTETQKTLATNATESVREFVEYYKGFQDQLATYNKQVNSTLNSSLGMFDSELAKGVDSLGASIHSLADFLTNMETSLAAVQTTLEAITPKEEAA